MAFASAAQPPSSANVRVERSFEDYAYIFRYRVGGRWLKILDADGQEDRLYQDEIEEGPQEALELMAYSLGRPIHG